MKSFSLILCFLCLLSCKNDDESDIDCALFDPFIKNLHIKLIDNNGNNLIENETYIADDIKIKINENEYTNVVFKNVEGIKNLITLNLLGIAGENIYEVELSNNEIDTLILNLTLEPTICGFSYVTLNSASYNSVILSIEDFNGSYLLTVVK
ncbi:hypothetical protein SAMN05428642_101922 [Flaviramulus basaltis]|uniref:Uncharacterized protein n=1 Tax=Flaviramulus basaltis TaxID=369401 RepID=A0A1K2IDS7_9FLAO|nr:hypothetical protein [Flaviramulus basaltis]SFZ90414.1 hypothetical protein SAMN05428642_101922 [Flaviramulus basaltis]